MPNHRFLLIVENNDIGYIIGYFRNSRKARKMAKEFVFKNEDHLNLTGVPLFENETKYQTFKIPPSARQFHPRYSSCITNGVFSAYVIDTRIVDDFTLKTLIFERINTIYAYNIENYDTDTTVYVKETLYFIAN
jgi:hypothetical protein